MTQKQTIPLCLHCRSSNMAAFPSPNPLGPKFLAQQTEKDLEKVRVYFRWTELSSSMMYVYVHVPLQYSSPSLSVTVVDSRLLPHSAQRKQVLCQGCTKEIDMVEYFSQEVNKKVLGVVFSFLFFPKLLTTASLSSWTTLTFPAPITFSAAQTALEQREHRSELPNFWEHLLVFALDEAGLDLDLEKKTLHSVYLLPYAHSFTMGVSRCCLSDYERCKNHVMLLSHSFDCRSVWSPRGSELRAPAPCPYP